MSRIQLTVCARIATDRGNDTNRGCFSHKHPSADAAATRDAPNSAPTTAPTSAPTSAGATGWTVCRFWGGGSHLSPELVALVPLVERDPVLCEPPLLGLKTCMDESLMEESWMEESWMDGAHTSEDLQAPISNPTSTVMRRAWRGKRREKGLRKA